MGDAVRNARASSFTVRGNKIVLFSIVWIKSTVCHLDSVHGSHRWRAWLENCRQEGTLSDSPCGTCVDPIPISIVSVVFNCFIIAFSCIELQVFTLYRGLWTGWRPVEYGGRFRSRCRGSRSKG